ncbi:MAG: hypothetical protein EBR82_63005 [Caulobacteraceae bacterium]|nr:hypothetical protein [Caulobacteraceae bacterium]
MSSTNDLANPLWRLRNLYHIKRADDGRIIKFEPRPEQQRVYDMLFKEGVKRLIILKARRLGMSTALDVLLTDQMLWNAGTQCSLVDQTAADAERKLATIAKVAVDNLPSGTLQHVERVRDSGSILEVSVAGNVASSFFAGLRARGGTNNWLHLSEWGVIQADDPRRSEEILTGAIPSAEHGRIIVETTWKGGRGGHLWEIVKSALETPEEAKTDKDWRVVFFPWWRDPTYVVEGDVSTISPAISQYLDEMERTTGHTFTPQQRLWYDRQQRQLGLFIFREFPTTLDECFKSPVEGAIYAAELDKLRASGAISAFKYDNSTLVHTAWDLGSPVNTVVWYFQVIKGNEIRVIDCDVDLDLTPVQRVGHMLAKGYAYGAHYLPHDAAATRTSGKADAQVYTEAGLANVRVLPRTHDIWIGINACLQMFPRFSFRLPACERGLDALANYAYKRSSATGIVVNEPVHNWASHAADALRMIAEAEMAGMLKTGFAKPRPTVVTTGIRELDFTRRTIVRR